MASIDRVRNNMLHLLLVLLLMMDLIAIGHGSVDWLLYNNFSYQRGDNVVGGMNVALSGELKRYFELSIRVVKASSRTQGLTVCH